MASQPVQPQILEPETHHLERKPLAEVALSPAPAHALAIQRAPAVVLEEAHKAAEALMQVVESKPRKVVINGKTFLQYEDWQTLGRFYGVTAAVRTTSYVEQGRVRGYEARAEALLVATNQVISGAEALCMDDEDKWRDKPLYQLKSMAQTRACAKALRNVLAWVVVLAGYSATPAEEMDGGTGTVSSPRAESHGSSRLAHTRVEEMVSKLARAANYDQLQATFREAYSEASKAEDKGAQATYIAAKDKRRGELRNGNVNVNASL